MTNSETQKVQQALDSFQIETPSWGFADTGTRFGKFLQDAAAIDINDKLADAGQVHAFTGFCPSVAAHVLWDFSPNQGPHEIVKLAQKYGVRIGAINPNLFQDQIYKYGSICNRDQGVRAPAIDHLLESANIATQVGSGLIAICLADGSNYPEQPNIRGRKNAMSGPLQQAQHRLQSNP